jgi:NTP pyrophosphatase (non-canonical NTP hydrolase)
MTTRDDSNTTVAELKAVVQQFVDERNWRKFHNAKNLSMSLAIEAAELMEHFQWLTTDEVVAGEQQNFAEIADELADVTCYALAIANVLQIDVAQAVTSKMVKNRLKYPSEPKKL